MEDSAYVYSDDIKYELLKIIPKDGTTIGSIGCGYATTEATLVASGRQVHGVDISIDAIEVASQRLTSARVITPDNRMPFDENSLDGLILPDVLEHIPLAWEYLNEYTKMVKPGGWVVISVPNMRYLPVLATLCVKGEWYEVPQGIFDKTHVQVMTHKRLMRWCHGANLSLERWHDFYDYRFVWRNIYRVLNILTFRQLRSFTNIEILGVFRKNT